jgi:hypothetical protein
LWKRFGEKAKLQKQRVRSNHISQAMVFKSSRLLAAALLLFSLVYASSIPSSQGLAIGHQAKDIEGGEEGDLITDEQEVSSPSFVSRHPLSPAHKLD